MDRRQSVRTSEKVYAFELELPKELDVKPKWQINLPNGASCRVFETEETVRRAGPDGVYHDVSETAYRLDFRSKSGAYPRALSSSNFFYNRSGEGIVVSKPLDVRLIIERAVYEMSKKSRTTVVEEE